MKDKEYIWWPPVGLDRSNMIPNDVEVINGENKMAPNLNTEGGSFYVDDNEIMADEEWRTASEELIQLASLEHPTPTEDARLEMLSIRIEDYEKVRWPIEPPRPPRQRIANAWYLGKAEMKKTFIDWYNYIAVVISVTVDSLNESIGYLMLWIRDYIFGSIAVAIVLLFMAVGMFGSYLIGGLVQRLGIDVEEEDA